MDMSQYLDVFLDEGREQLVLLETNVLNMERGDHSLDLLQVIFRAAHTLKGSSRTMNFLRIGDLTHEMENILDSLRQGTLPVTTSIIDALLECLDALTGLIEVVAATGTDAGGQDASGLVTRLNMLRNGSGENAVPIPASEKAEAGETSLPLTDFELVSLDDAQAAGLTVFHLQITLCADCLMKSVRVFMVLSALEPLGTVLVAHPREELLEEEQFEDTFQLLLASESEAAPIEAALAEISELDIVTVIPWQRLVVEDLPEDVPAIAAVVPSPASPSVAPSPPAPPAVHTPTIRVDVARLDTLLNLIGELVIDRTQITRLGEDLLTRYPQDERVGALLDATHRVARITGELQDEIMKTRMLPIDGVFQRLPRMVRDLAQKTGKEVDFRMSGGETELDRSVLESLGDPLIHLLRNSVDHGIETPEARLALGKPAVGLVTLDARHEENQIVIEIRDDGKGMAPDKIKAAAIAKGLLTADAAAMLGDQDALHLIFASGFSTAQTLSDISGRGVGMDIVKSNLENMGGRVLVSSAPGVGSVFTIHLPLTLAIVRALLVSAAGGTYVLPLGSVVELVRLGHEEGQAPLRTVGGQAAILLRGRTIPLAGLADVLCEDPGATSPACIAPDAYVVIIGWGEKQVGLCVDALVGEQEVVIKSLGVLLGDLRGLSGATILGDGRVALIVDAARAVEGVCAGGAATRQTAGIV